MHCRYGKERATEATPLTTPATGTTKVKTRFGITCQWNSIRRAKFDIAKKQRRVDFNIVGTIWAVNPSYREKGKEKRKKCRVGNMLLGTFYWNAKLRDGQARQKERKDRSKEWGF